MRTTKSRYLFIAPGCIVVAGLLTAPEMAAQGCALSAGQRNELAWTEMAKGHEGYDYARGLIFESAGCLAEARRSFSDALNGSGAARSDGNREQLRVAAESMLRIVGKRLSNPIWT
jgi:hypothetical protein